MFSRSSADTFWLGLIRVSLESSSGQEKKSDTHFHEKLHYLMPYIRSYYQVFGSVYIWSKLGHIRQLLPGCFTYSAIFSKQTSRPSLCLVDVVRRVNELCTECSKFQICVWVAWLPQRLKPTRFLKKKSHSPALVPPSGLLHFKKFQKTLRQTSNFCGFFVLFFRILKHCALGQT